MWLQPYGKRTASTFQQTKCTGVAACTLCTVCLLGNTSPKLCPACPRAFHSPVAITCGTYLETVKTVTMLCMGTWSSILMMVVNVMQRLTAV